MGNASISTPERKYSSLSTPTLLKNKKIPRSIFAILQGQQTESGKKDRVNEEMSDSNKEEKYIPLVFY